MTIWTLWGLKKNRLSADLVALFSYEPSKSELEEWEEEQERETTIVII